MENDCDCTTSCNTDAYECNILDHFLKDICGINEHRKEDENMRKNALYQYMLATFFSVILVVTSLGYRQIEGQRDVLQYAEAVPLNTETSNAMIFGAFSLNMTDSSFLVTKIERMGMPAGGNITAPKIYLKCEDGIDFGDFTEEEIDLMAACVYYEAGNQDLDKKRLVVDVILNRLESDRFPDSIKDVLSAPGQFTTWKKIVKSSPEDIPIECYGAVMAEIELCKDDRMDMETLGFSAYSFSADYQTCSNKFRGM